MIRTNYLCHALCLYIFIGFRYSCFGERKGKGNGREGKERGRGRKERGRDVWHLRPK